MSNSTAAKVYLRAAEGVHDLDHPLAGMCSAIESACDVLRADYDEHAKWMEDLLCPWTRRWVGEFPSMGWDSPNGTDIVSDRYVTYWGACWSDDLEERIACRVLGLCLMAAIAEAGDL